MAYSFNQVLKKDFNFLTQQWDDEIIPLLQKYIAIPNKSPMFDAQWQENGFMQQAMELLVNWCKQQPIKDLSIKLLQDDKRTPLLFMEIPGNTAETVLLYGHMDKQPEMKGWDDDKGPWQPVIQNGKLYGRGGADDGYSTFSALSAIAWLQKNNLPHPRCVIIIEASEESGSVDLPHYLQQLTDKIGQPKLVICLDSSCANYQQLWGTTSLRGVVGGNLTIKVLTEGIHSGLGSGSVPSVFMVLQQLLARIENSNTGEVIFPELKVSIPTDRIEQAKIAAQSLDKEYRNAFPLLNDTRLLSNDVTELILNKSWRAALSVVGLDGLPPVADAGNVTLPDLAVKLSLRTPPTCDVNKAAAALKTTLETNPPFNATVKFDIQERGAGWHSPPLADWLAKACDNASQLFFNRNAAYMGEGGSIPFMGMLGRIYPQAQFLITGVLGPKSNAHGPNEFLHIDMVKKITGCVAAVLASQADNYVKHKN